MSTAATARAPAAVRPGTMSSSRPRSGVDDGGRPRPGAEPALGAHNSTSSTPTADTPPTLCVGVEQRRAPAAHRRVHPVPATAQLSRDVADRSAAADLASRPAARARRQHLALCGDLWVLLGDRARRTAPIRAAPAPLAPHQPRRPAERPQVRQLHGPLAVGPQRPAAAVARRARRPAADAHPQRPPAMSSAPTTSTSPRPTSTSLTRVGSRSTGILQTPGCLSAPDPGDPLALSRG